MITVGLGFVTIALWLMVANLRINRLEEKVRRLQEALGTVIERKVTNGD